MEGERLTLNTTISFQTFKGSHYRTFKENARFYTPSFPNPIPVFAFSPWHSHGIGGDKEVCVVE